MSDIKGSMRFRANTRNDRLLLGHMGSGGGSQGRAFTTTLPGQNKLSFRMDSPLGGGMRNRIPIYRDELTEGNLTSNRKIKELMCMVPDIH